ncbi:MAG: hypothetical protein JWL87_492 [Candidatus Adlerbacteria bacterium]|nr:hypothetical protein [Candidatus Adlerbacteria bacterium]
MDIFSEIKKHNFPVDEYVVIGGAALAARGLKETNDIDIVVSPKLLDEYRNKEGWHHHPRIIPTEEAGVANDEGTIELYPNVGGIAEMTFERLKKNSELIDGVPFAGLRDVKLVKEVYAREKDLIDVAKIEAYLASK